MNYSQRKEKILQYIKTYGEISNSEAQAITSAHRNTITGDFQKLVSEKILNISGKGKGAKYTRLDLIIFSQATLTSVFSKKNNTQFNQFFNKVTRPKSFFNKTFDKDIVTFYTRSVFNNSEVDRVEELSGCKVKNIEVDFVDGHYTAYASIDENKKGFFYQQ